MSRDSRRSLWLAENLFDEVQFSTFTVTASTSPVGSEYWRVANGRRSDADQWRPTTQNSTHWIQVLCPEGRAANLLVVDRENNLQVGGQFILEARNTSTQGWQFVAGSTSIELGAYPHPSTGRGGARTWEGAHVCAFPTQSMRFWRFRVPPSASYAPRLSGVYLGKAWETRNPPVGPFDPEGTEVSFDAAATPSGWVGAGRAAVVRSGVATYRLEGQMEYAAAYSFLQDFERRRPTWCVPYRGDGSQAFMCTVQSGTRAAPWNGDTVGRTVVISYREHEPRSL